MASENVSFNDQTPGFLYDQTAGVDYTRDIAVNDDADLGSFFSRPLKIAEYSWSTSVALFQDFNPWTLYCENPKVMNRLANFNVLRGTLKVKILINGNGFYYGRAIASYLPLHNSDSLTQNRALIYQDLVAASQRPHIYLDPTMNQGGELSLPFFYYFDNLNIPENWYTEMGEMNIRELNQLRHANGATDPITISVLAWMEDVKLAVPTSTNPAGLPAQGGFESKQVDVQCCDNWWCCKKDSTDPRANEPQNGFEPQGSSKSKKKKNRVSVTMNKSGRTDEFGSGPVSGVASTISRIAGMVSKAPVIGPYAKATEIAASGVANIAKLFGYSRAPTLAPIHQYTPRYFGDMVHMNTPDTSTKLSFDAKQELSVDGRITGVSNDDEMTIKSIMCRESFLDQTTWTTGDAVDQIIMSLNVVPDLVNILGVPDPNPDEYHMPASCFGVKPFKYWRGSMKFRFQVVASAYHKGRLKLQWDPFGYENQEMNTQYTHIIDISEDKDFTIEIGWGSNYGWLKVRPMFDTPAGYTLRAAQTSIDQSFVNGTVTLSVLNTLTSPSLSAGDTVEVNAFIAAGDDIEVAVPSDQNIEDMTPLQPYSAQSGMESVPQGDEENTTQPSAPVQTMVKRVLGNELDDSDASLLVYHGESIPSYRSVLKRYAYTGILSLGATNAYRMVQDFIKHMPPLPGVTSGAWWHSLTVNYVKMTPLAYISSAFKAQRGGVRWKAAYLSTNDLSSGRDAYVFARLNPDTDAVVGVQTATLIDLSGSVVPAEQYGTFLPPTYAGYDITPVKQNPTVEVEVPYQTQRRFWQPRWIANNTSTGDRVFSLGAICNAGTGGAGLYTFSAAGEDFSLHFFIGAPVMVDVNYSPPPP